MDLSTPGFSERIGRGCLIWGVGLTLCAYLFNLGYSVYQRKGKEAVVTDAWLAACQPEADADTCDEMLDEQQDDCLRESRHFDRGITFEKSVFFECMNERNSARIELDVPRDEDRPTPRY